jgi:hypothetical protein
MSHPVYRKLFPAARSRRGVSLLGCLAVPTNGLSIVLGNAAAFCVHDPEIVLSFGDALVRREAIPLHCLGIVLRHAMAGRVHDPEIVLGIGDALAVSIVRELVCQLPHYP